MPHSSAFHCSFWWTIDTVCATKGQKFNSFNYPYFQLQFNFTQTFIYGFRKCESYVLLVFLIIHTKYTPRWFLRKLCIQISVVYCCSRFVWSKKKKSKWFSGKYQKLSIYFFFSFLRNNRLINLPFLFHSESCKQTKK